ncbi:hypothetical protein SAMN05444157_1609 [Frankineae bacterium MT45]|nr:hypothetical protein SAMN05444157_1609 [Frankineae bacterium MT45]
MPDQIDMPADCSRCDGTWDLNAMFAGPRNTVVCPPCRRELDEEEEEPEDNDERW